ASPPTGYLPTSAYPAMAYPAMQPPVGKGAGGRGSATLLWVLVGVFAVLLCSGAAVAGVLAYRNATDDGTPTATAAPSPPPTTAAEPRPDDPTPSPDDSPSPGATGSGVVTYEITGAGRATITYSLVADRKTQRVSSARLPWRIQVPTPAGDAPFVASVMAMRTGTEGEGKLTCRVLVDGKEITERSSGSNSSRFASVFCIHVVQR
ncbi:MAG TPA: MmpS family transport accessory protein, partial [Pilimelia sp.]|nr:MmpS family transport accessory protein [Pilimelia sp.]